MDFLQFVVTVTVGHITVGNITVVCSYSWQKLQLSVITVGRSYSCLWLQLAEVTDNILHLSANRRKWRSGGKWSEEMMLEGLLASALESTTVLKYPPEIKKVPDDMIIFSKITV